MPAAGTARAAWDEDDPVICVDEHDNEIGLAPRLQAHGPEARLHRAFMVLLVDKAGLVLLTRRSAHKRLWPRFWADSCAGHPRPGEGVIEAGERRVREELGCGCTLRSLGHFVYRSSYGDAGCEYELCHVLTGSASSALAPDTAEVSEVQSIRPRVLRVLARERPGDFVPWLGECLKRFTF